ncbi:MAG: AAA family ATPase [Burkholderiales bacterium]|nr:AAA family ATPase [Burkholderiales bacterium]
MTAAALPVPFATGNGFSIPIAGFKRVYDCADVEEAMAEVKPGQNDALRDTYEKMLKAGGNRFSVKPSSLPAMDELYSDLPNFADVLDDIKRQLSLCVASRDNLEIAPMLLLGDPGIGKTHFARRVSRLLGTGFGFISMSSLTAGWIIGGASSQWKNAKPGKVFETFLRGEYANPVMLVDEIDKSAADGAYDPLGALYSLLEHDTAAEFIDEFVEVPIDASDVVWIATANEARAIPEPILNRMNVYEIDTPDAEQSRRIAGAIYREIRGDHDWGTRFPEAPSAAVLDRLCEVSPREMRRLINKAFGNASLAGRDELVADDIDARRGVRKARIGF